MLEIQPEERREVDIEADMCTLEGTGRVLHLIRKVSSVLGIIPAEIEKDTFEVKFKLFSFTSLKSLLKLLLFNSPLIVSPLVLNFSGLVDREYKSLGLNVNEAVDGDNDIYANQFVFGVASLIYWSSYLYYIVPFILWQNMADPLTKLSKILIAERNKHIVRKPPSAEELLLPLVSLIIFYVGTFVFALALIQQQESLYPGIASCPGFVFLIFGFGFTSQLGLQFILGVQEFFFYHFSTYYRRFSQSVLDSTDDDQTLTMTGDLIEIMKHFQQCYGLFLLVDLTIMLFYWLTHCYMAYVAFHTSALSFLGSLLVVIAEFLRVIAISNTCEHLTR